MLRTLVLCLRTATLSAAILLIFSTVSAQALELRSDGIHTESWMKSMTFLDLGEDLAEAQAQGKGLVVIFEQPGCGSCKRLHEVNFQDPALVDYLTRHFDFIQINMYGANLVTDFDGEELSEKALARKYVSRMLRVFWHGLRSAGIQNITFGENMPLEAPPNPPEM